MYRRIGTSIHAGVLLAVLGVLAWATGQPVVFPSLGPTAFVLAADGRSERTSARRVVGGHLVGGVAGLAAWTFVAGGVPVTAAVEPASAAGARLAASAVLSTVATSAGMRATGTVHPPACATTLIVSLGLLSTPRHVGLIVASVVVLFCTHRLVVTLADRRAERRRETTDRAT